MSNDAERSGTFTEDEMRDYNPQPCETCGLPTMRYEFEDTLDSHGLPRPVFILRSSICTNAECASHGGAENPEGTQVTTGTVDTDGAVV